MNGFLGRLSSRLRGDSVALPPADRDALVQRAILHQNREEWIEAAQGFRRVVEADPGFVGAWCDLATSLSQLDRHDEAVACCAKAIELDPQHLPSLIQLGVI